MVPVSNDGVTKLPRLPHEMRGLSDGLNEDVEATRDAIFTTTSSSSSFFTLSQCHCVSSL